MSSANVYMNGFNPYANNGDDIPNDPGKMFIGGLSWQTTPESIREYFSSFGDLAEVMVMKDPATRRSRGFGFITFSDPTGVEKVLKYPVHQLDGKIVEPKVAVPRKTNPKLVMRTKKIFVGGLSATTSLEDIRAYFEQFSHVQDAMLAYDKITNRHRGFGFVTFDNEDVVDKICEIHFHEINGKMVESKKALPKEPRLSYYSSYTNPYYGGGVGPGHSQLSPPGTRNYYGPTGYPGPGGYMNGNRFYQHHPHFQGYYDRTSNSVERSNNGYNNQDSHQEFSVTTSNNNPTSPPTSVGSNPNSGSSNNNSTSTTSSRLYSKYNNNLVPPGSNENGVYNTGIRNNKQQHMDEHQRMKQYFNEFSNKQVNDDLTYMSLNNYNGNGNNGGSGSGSFSGGSGGGGDRGGVGAYEDDFPELTTTKFSQLRLNNSGDRLSPPVNNVPSNNTSDFCF